MSTLSQQVHQIADQLAPDATWDDVLREVGLRAAIEPSRLEALRAAAAAGLDDLEAGRFRHFDDARSLGEYLDSVVESRVKAALAG